MTNPLLLRYEKIKYGKKLRANGKTLRREAERIHKAKGKKPKVSHGVKSEKRVAAELGANSILASGALSGLKGDSELPSFLVESKSTTKKAIGLQQKWLKKISHEAFGKNKHPALTLSFVDEDGRAQAGGDWFCIPLGLAKSLGLV